MWGIADELELRGEYGDRDKSNEVLGALTTWKRYWERQTPPRLTYRAVGDTLEIRDFRPTYGPARYIFRAVEREILRVCDEGVSRTRVVAMAKETDPEITVAAVGTYLEQLIRAGLVIYVDKRYLALAVPESGAAQLE